MREVPSPLLINFLKSGGPAMVSRRVAYALAGLVLGAVGVVVTATAAQAAGPTATFVKVSDWGSGWEGKFTITNGGTTAISSWTIQFDLPPGTTVGSFWDALITSSGNHYTA